jgi:tetratricopeptide (TPR) repeat protein
MKRFYYILICAGAAGLTIAWQAKPKHWPSALSVKAQAKLKESQIAATREQRSKILSWPKRNGAIIVGHDPYVPTPEEEAAALADAHAESNSVLASRAARKAGNLKRAAEILEARLDLVPWRGHISSELADIYFRLGQNQRAYEAIAPHAIEGAEPQRLLRASYAASLMGEVYPGQWKYCLDQIRAYNLFTDTSYLPAGRSNRDLITVSLLAIGVESNSHGHDEETLFYAEEAVKRDRTNPIGHYLIGKAYQHQKYLKKAVKSLETALPRAKGELKDSIVRELYDLRHMVKAGLGKGG